MQLYTSAGDCKVVRNIPGSHFVKAFLVFPSPSCWCQLHHKRAVPSMLISVKSAGKNQMQPGQVSTGHAPLLSHCSLLRDHWSKQTGVLEYCHEGETNCLFSIFQGVTSDCIPKANKAHSSLLTVLHFPSCSNFVRYTNEFWFLKLLLIICPQKDSNIALLHWISNERFLSDWFWCLWSIATGRNSCNSFKTLFY
jgi:hypothetical protein